MNQLPDGQRFRVFRHMISSPLHLTIVVVVMLALMAFVMFAH